MKIVVGDLLTIKGEKYITMDVVPYGGVNYAFVNKMTKDEEPTDEFYTFEILEKSVKRVEDKKILDILLPMFSSSVQNMIDKIMNNDIPVEDFYE